MSFVFALGVLVLFFFFNLANRSEIFAGFCLAGFLALFTSLFNVSFLGRELLGTLLLGASLVISVSRNRVSVFSVFRRSKGQAFFVLLIVVSFGVHAVWGSCPAYSAVKFREYFYYNVLFFIAPIIFSFDEEKIKGLFNSYFFTGLCFSFFAVVFGRNLLADSKQLEMLGRGSIGTGRIGGVTALIAIFYFLRSKGAKRKMLFFMAAVIGLATLILSGTRGALIALAVACVPVFLFVRSGSFAKQVISTAVMFAVVFFLIQLTPEAVASRWSELSSVHSVAEMDRIPIIERALAMVADAPVYGNGIGSYFERYATWPHNIFIEMLVEFGVVGLLWFIVFLLMTCLKAIAFIRNPLYPNTQRNFVVLLVCCLLFFLIEAQFSLDIPGNCPVWLFSGLIYSIYYLNGQKNVAGSAK